MTDAGPGKRLSGLHDHLARIWRRAAVVGATAALFLDTALYVLDNLDIILGWRVLWAVVVRIEIKQSVHIGADAIIHVIGAPAPFRS